MELDAAGGADGNAGGAELFTIDVEGLETVLWSAPGDGKGDTAPEPLSAAATSRMARAAGWLANSGFAGWLEPEVNIRIKTTARPTTSTTPPPKLA
ncbi:MAG: hypothetical protein ACLQVF_32520 [Isosphaeraceae bacterium]